MIARPNRTRVHAQKSGAALIVVMWILVIVSLIVSSFAFEMKLESQLTAARRKRMKADQLAWAGIEMAKAMLAFKDPFAEEDTIYEDAFKGAASRALETGTATLTEELGSGTVTVEIEDAQGRFNIKTMTDEDWKDLFETAEIPATDWDEMIDCLADWQDENELKQLNGAESDDAFYRNKDYNCKNAPVDTVDELQLIKGWTEEYLYGTADDEESESTVRGIASMLTTWGDGKINPNSASREVLESMGLAEGYVDAILEGQLGLDGEAGTDDDGLSDSDFASLGIDGSAFDLEPLFLKITSTGEVGGLKSVISTVFKLGGSDLSPLFWLEGSTQ